MKIPAMKVKQGQAVLYLTAMEAKELTKDKVTAPDAWSPTNRQGYQRPPMERRLKGIAEYVLGDHAKALLPQAILLNSREKLTFQQNGSGPFGTLDVNHTLWEVDGQHRIGGLRRACSENPDAMEGYMVPVVITEGVARIEEAVLFFVVNTQQKRVPTDIAQRIISEQVHDAKLKTSVIAQGKEWIAKATEVVDILVAREGQPWHERIVIPGLKKGGEFIKQVSFVQSLQPILDADKNPAYANLTGEDAAELLARYWEAVEGAFPEAFQDPKEYVITKTVGVFPLHSIAPVIFNHVREEHGKVTKGGLKEILGEIAHNLVSNYNLEKASEFWLKDETRGEAGKYAGAKGFRILRDILFSQLPQNTKTAAVL